MPKLGYKCHPTAVARRAASICRPLEPRFEANVMPEPNSGCHLWLGSLKNGYGVISVKGKQKYAHRLAFERAGKFLPEGHHVLHKCDVPSCVNPDHLYAGTPTQNARDAIDRGRGGPQRHPLKFKELGSCLGALVRKRRHDEANLQIAAAAFLDAALPSDVFFSSIDHAKRGKNEGAMLRRRGVKRGLPDALLFWNGGIFWIELKSQTGRLSEDQKKFRDACMAAGHHWMLCRSVEEIQEALLRFGIPLRARLP